MITTLVNLILAFSVQAQAAELHWVQLPNSPQKIVMAVEEGESRAQALAAYIEEMEASQDLKAFVQELRMYDSQDLRWGQIEPSQKKRVLLLANKVEDMTSRPDRVVSFQKTFEEVGAEVFVMPVAGLKALSSTERQKSMEMLSDEMDVVTAMGGADISPELYGRYNTYSRNVIHERDVWEAKLLKYVIEKEKAFVLGVCRGHQLVAVTQGFTLIQDIPSFVDTDINHEMDRHDIELADTTKGLLKKMTGQEGVVEVNSLHHQAVVYKESSRLVPAAHSADGLIEAFEFRNGKGLTVQFHPELMQEEWAKEILRNSVRMSSGSYKLNKCESLLRAS